MSKPQTKPPPAEAKSLLPVEAKSLPPAEAKPAPTSPIYHGIVWAPVKGAFQVAEVRFQDGRVLSLEMIGEPEGRNISVEQTKIEYVRRVLFGRE